MTLSPLTLPDASNRNIVPQENTGHAAVPPYPAPATPLQPTDGPMAALGASTVTATPYARYFPNNRGGGKLNFPKDGKSIQIKSPAEQTFDTAHRQFRQASTAAWQMIPSPKGIKTAFRDFAPQTGHWHASESDAAVDLFLKNLADATPQDSIYRRLYRAEDEPLPVPPSNGIEPPTDFTNDVSIRRHLRRLGAPEPVNADHRHAMTMFGADGPNLRAIVFNLDQLSRHIGATLPAEYAQAVSALDSKNLHSKMASAVREHFDRDQNPAATQLPSVPLRAVEGALHTAYYRLSNIAGNARQRLRASHDMPEAERKALVHCARLSTSYAIYLRELKRFVTTQAAPHHFSLAGMESARRFGPSPRVDDGKTSTSRVAVSGGGKIAAAVEATAALELTGNTSDFIDIDGDRNHIRINGVKVSFNLKEGLNKILSLYANQQVSAQYTNGRYLAHADPNSHFHAVYQSYVQHPRRADIGARFMRTLIDRSSDPRKTKVRISVDRFFSELQRFLSGVESLSTSDAVPRYASKSKLGRGRNACDLHRQALQIDAITSGSPHQGLPSLTSAVQAALPLRAQEMKPVISHLDAAQRASTLAQLVDELKNASDLVDGLIAAPDVPPVPGGANRPGTGEPDPAYWGTTRIAASVNAGAGINTSHYLKALATFDALSKESQKETTKPKPPSFSPTLEFKLETDASFRKGELQRVHINPHRALSPEYLPSKSALLKTLNDVRSLLTLASSDGEHPYLAFVDRFDAFADLRDRQAEPESPSPTGVHARDAWLERMLGQGKLRPELAAQRLTGSYRQVARQMAAFMAIESDALHAAPQSPQAGAAIRLINNAFWQGRHAIDPATATREQIDVFVGMTRGMIALACSDVDKNMALVTDAAVRRRQDLSLDARTRFEAARNANAAYAKFIAKCFAKGNDLGNEHHARHAVVLQPGPSNRDDFTVTVTLPSLKLPAVDAAIPTDGTLATALGPVTDNLALLSSLNLTYQSTVFKHPAPLPRSGTGETYTAAGRLSFLLGGQLPLLFHAIKSGQAAAKVDSRNPTSGRVANHVLNNFASNEFPSDFKTIFREEMDRTGPHKGIAHKIFHALTTTETSGITVRRFRHAGSHQPSLVRDVSWWVEIRGGVSFTPELLAYFQPGTTLKAGGGISGVHHLTLGQRLGNEPFYNSMNFMKTGGLNALLKKDAVGNFDLQHLLEVFDQNIEACRTWMGGASPGSLGAVVDNYEQLLDYARQGGPQVKVHGNALSALQHDAWRDVVDNGQQWSQRDPKNTGALEQLDQPGALQQLLAEARTARPLSPEERRRLKAMSARERTQYLVQQRPDVLLAVFRLYTALNTANGFVKNAVGYGPAVNSLFGSVHADAAPPATIGTAPVDESVAYEADKYDEDDEDDDHPDRTRDPREWL